MKLILATLIYAASLFGAGLAQGAELVMFDDPACVYCKRWLAEIGPGYPHTEEGQRAPLRRVYIRDQARSGLKLNAAVNATPTFVLADDEGLEVGRLTGYPGADYFYPLLGELLRKLPPARRPAPALRETQFHAR